MINLGRVALAVQDGYTVVCATCEWFHRARDAGREPCGQRGCGGPIGGGEYRHYKGPIVEFSQICFVCGARSTHAIRNGDSKRTFGLCGEHLPLVYRAERVGAPTPPVAAVIIENGLIPVEKLVPPKKKSLIEAIVEAETYFAEKDRDPDRD